MANEQAVPASESPAASSRAQVAFGPNVIPGNFAGMSVKDLRKKVGPQLNVAQDARAYVGEREVDADYILGADEKLTFIKRAGEKG